MDDLLLCFACVKFSLIVHQYSANILGLNLPWYLFLLWKCPGEITVPAFRSLTRNFLGRSLSESLIMQL